MYYAITARKMKKNKYIPTTKGRSWKVNQAPTKPLRRIIVIAKDYNDFNEHVNARYGFNELRYPVFKITDANNKRFNSIEHTDAARSLRGFNDIDKHCNILLRKNKENLCKCRKAHEVKAEVLCSNCGKLYNFNRAQLRQ